MRQIEGVSEPFVANDGGRWFIMQTTDYSDAEGYFGMSTAILGDPWGYDTEAKAEAALATLP